MTKFNAARARDLLGARGRELECPGPDEGDGESGPDMIEPCCPVHFPRFFSVPGVRTFETSADDCVCAYCNETLDECGCDEPLFQL